MGKSRMFFALILLIGLVNSANAQWYYNSKNIITSINVSSNVDIIPTKVNGYVDTATINLTFYPRQAENQQILIFNAKPEPKHDENSLSFTWKNPRENVAFEVDSKVRTINTITKVTHKIKFPIDELPEDIAKYTRPSATIDSDDEDIVKLGSELVKGEDDLYSAVFKVAKWTKNNVEYNLSTLTADVSQKASWVLQNRQGVCDELTSLFIALLRSVGVPAKFVSGIAYTNSELFPEKWGPHGWAEVYFREYGWIPFDVTYGEFGWTDPTHIKFKESVDSDEASTYYYWYGRNVDFETRKLDIKTNLVDFSGYSNVPLSIEVSPFNKLVKFGSYNLVEATVENPNLFYYSTELILSKPREVKNVGDELRQVLLLPLEKKKISWVVKVDNGLNEKYSYTMPIAVSTSDNMTSSSSFETNVRGTMISLADAEKISRLIEEETEKKYSANVDISCKSKKNEFYEYENVKIECAAKNSGNVLIDNADFCVQDDCKKIVIGISQVKNELFNINKSIAGDFKLPVSVRSDSVSKTIYFNLKVNDIPKAFIEELKFPVNVSYGDNFSLDFKIVKKSQSNPKNLAVSIELNGVEKMIEISELNESRGISLKLNAGQLSYGNNDFKINLIYEDGLKKVYNSDASFSINLVKASILQRVFLLPNYINLKILEELTVIVVIAAIVFVIIVILTFRNRKDEIK